MRDIYVKELITIGFITTVLGAVPESELGFCQSHEHVYLAKGHSYEVNADLCIDDAEKSIGELTAYRKAGGSAVVDAQPVGCGRDAEALAKLSRESGVKIIASTGFHKLMFYQDSHWIRKFGSDKLARLYLSELTKGMYALCDSSEPCSRTEYRAGQIKSALDAGAFSVEYEKLFTAAAEAAKETGRALMVHIESGSNPIALSDFLFKVGVRLDRVIFCHMDRAVADLAVHKEICARGITMEYDTVARAKYHDDAREIEILKKMLEWGFENQILMSLDVTRARLKSYGGSVGLDYILNEFLPKLTEAGVSRTAADKIFMTNPARIFS